MFEQRVLPLPPPPPPLCLCLGLCPGLSLPPSLQNQDLYKIRRTQDTHHPPAHIRPHTKLQRNRNLKEGARSAVPTNFSKRFSLPRPKRRVLLVAKPVLWRRKHFSARNTWVLPKSPAPTTRLSRLRGVIKTCKLVYNEARGGEERGAGRGGWTMGREREEEWGRGREAKKDLIPLSSHHIIIITRPPSLALLSLLLPVRYCFAQTSSEACRSHVQARMNNNRRPVFHSSASEGSRAARRPGCVSGRRCCDADNTVVIAPYRRHDRWRVTPSSISHAHATLFVTLTLSLMAPP